MIRVGRFKEQNILGKKAVTAPRITLYSNLHSLSTPEFRFVMRAADYNADLYNPFPLQWSNNSAMSVRAILNAMLSEGFQDDFHDKRVSQDKLSTLSSHIVRILGELQYRIE